MKIRHVPGQAIDAAESYLAKKRKAFTEHVADWVLTIFLLIVALYLFGIALKTEWIIQHFM